MQLAVLSWAALDARSWPGVADMEPADVAHVLDAYAQRVIAPRGSTAVSGLELMTALRPPTRAVGQGDRPVGLRAYISASQEAGWRCGSAPDPGPGSGVELACCEAGGLFDLAWSGEGLAGQGSLAEDAPPAFLQVQPARADGDEDVPDSGVALQPGPGGQAVVRGQVVGDDVDAEEGLAASTN